MTPEQRPVADEGRCQHEQDQQDQQDHRVDGQQALEHQCATGFPSSPDGSYDQRREDDRDGDQADVDLAAGEGEGDEAVEEAHHHRREDRAVEAAQPAEDDDGEGLRQREQPHRRVDDAVRRGHDPGQPASAEPHDHDPQHDALGPDADQDGGLGVLGHGAHHPPDGVKRSTDRTTTIVIAATTPATTAS
jgi:hypothetical protein